MSDMQQHKVLEVRVYLDKITCSPVNKSINTTPLISSIANARSDDIKDKEMSLKLDPVRKYSFNLPYKIKVR